MLEINVSKNTYASSPEKLRNIISWEKEYVWVSRRSGWRWRVHILKNILNPRWRLKSSFKFLYHLLMDKLEKSSLNKSSFSNSSAYSCCKINGKSDIREMLRQLVKFHLTRKQPPKSWPGSNTKICELPGGRRGRSSPSQDWKKETSASFFFRLLFPLTRALIEGQLYQQQQ